jgi:hypothetical protein
MGASDNKALQALERELADYEGQIAASRISRRGSPRRIFFFLLLPIGIVAAVLAIAWPNISVSALWRDWGSADQDTAGIVELKKAVDEMAAAQKEMATSISALQAEHGEIRATLRQQKEDSWYSYPPALHFRNPFPPRTRPAP